MTAYLLALDQGTSSSRAILFGTDMRPLAQAAEEFPQSFPHPGWVEHAPEDLWRTTLSTARTVLNQAGIAPHQVAAIGIANQRETTLLWNRATGRPLYPAIVWQDRRTAPACAALEAAGHGPRVQRRTGLRLDPYFSATKLAWLLDTLPGARTAAEAGQLAFGTVDTWLLWQLTNGQIHATDATNAARTLLLDLETGAWDPEMLDLFRIPPQLLPEIRDTTAPFGHANPAHLGAAIPIHAMAGDQQAALAGQGCVHAGMVKATYGTGCFMLLHTGNRPVASRHQLLTTIALQRNGHRTYALEGAIFVAGAAVQWLRDGLGLIGRASEAGALAARADPAQHVVLVPAFVGLGAPHWDPDAKGILVGLTRNSGPAEIARAALECVAFQTADLMDAMHADGADTPATILRVDGGMSASDWTMQCVADILERPVERPHILETTALGAAYLAGLGAGLLPEPHDFAATWEAEHRFVPMADPAATAQRRAAWADAVSRSRSR